MGFTMLTPIKNKSETLYMISKSSKGRCIPFFTFGPVFQMKISEPKALQMEDEPFLVLRSNCWSNGNAI